MPLIEVIEIKSGKTKYVGEWALKDPKQLANLGFKLADDSQTQAISDAESISAAVKKKLNDAAAAKKIEAQPIHDVEIEPVHELVNPLEDGYENIQEAESATPELVDATKIEGEGEEEAATESEVEPEVEIVQESPKAEKKKAGRPAKAK